MLMPKKTKHRKWHKGRDKKASFRGTNVVFGAYGLKAQGSKWISSREIEAGRRTIIRYLRKGGKMWIRIFPNRPITKKGDETPMGGGTGSVDHYAFSVDAGRIIYEIDGIEESLAKEALKKAGGKLSVRTKVVER